VHAHVYLAKNRNLSKILLLDDECVAARLLTTVSVPPFEKARDRDPLAPLFHHSYSHHSQSFPRNKEFRGRNESARERGKHPLVEEI